jgi:hypothetical protein
MPPDEIAAPAAPIPSTPGVPNNPDVGTSGAAPGTLPAAAETAAPAASSSEAAPAAAETTTETKPTSVLSTATGEKAAEAPAAEVAAPEAEKPPPEPAPLPTYEAFKFPEGVTPDETQVSAFTGILGEFERRIAADPAQAHAAAQEMGQKFVDLYAAQSKADGERWAQLLAERWQRTQDDWIAQGKKDPEVGKNRYETSVQRAGAVIEMYGRKHGAERETAVRDAFGLTGAGNHPALLHFFDYLARQMTEAPTRMVPARVPSAPQPGSKATRLYRNTPGAGAQA